MEYEAVTTSPCVATLDDDDDEEEEEVAFEVDTGNVPAEDEENEEVALDLRASAECSTVTTESRLCPTTSGSLRALTSARSSSSVSIRESSCSRGASTSCSYHWKVWDVDRERLNK